MTTQPKGKGTMAKGQIHLHYDGDGRLSQVGHFLNDTPAIEPHATAYNRDHNANEPWIGVRIGTAVLYLSPAQAEALLAELAAAVEAVRPDTLGIFDLGASMTRASVEL